MNERKPIDRIDSGISDGEEERFEGHSPLRTADSDRVFKFGADNDDMADNSNEKVDNSGKDKNNDTINAVKERIFNNLSTIKTSSIYLSIGFLTWIVGYFGFSLLWIIAGVSIFLWRENKRKSRESITQVLSAIAKDERKFFQSVKQLYNVSGRDLPSWVYFPDVEKAEWLNKMIEQLWPHISEYIEKILMEKVEPSIRESNKLLSGFHFSKVSLGEKSPRVAGIKVYDNGKTRRTEIVMDVQLILVNSQLEVLPEEVSVTCDMSLPRKKKEVTRGLHMCGVYDSDCNIRVSINRLNAGTKNLSVRGLLRIEMRPLINSIPLVGAISVAFVHHPNIEFDLTNLGNFLDFPLIDRVLRSAISDIVSALFVLPEKYFIKLCDDINISNLMYPLPKGVVRIHVIEAKNLEEKDKKILGIGGRSDPYVEIQVGQDYEFQTRTIEHNINPKWNETFEAIVNHVHSSSILITVYDYDGPLNKADDLGIASIDMKSVYNRGTVDEWIQLSNVKSGSIHVKIEWLDLCEDLSHLEEAMEFANAENLNSAFLSVYVDSARDLPGFNEGKYEPNPSVKIVLPGQKALKTKVIPHTTNPTWEENFKTLVKNPKMESISFNVEDAASSDECLGTLKIGLSKLLKCPGMTCEEPFTLLNSGPYSQLTLRLTLRILRSRNVSADPLKPTDDESVTAEEKHTSENEVEGDEEKKETIPLINPEIEPKVEEVITGITESPAFSPLDSSESGFNFENRGSGRNGFDNSIHRTPSMNSEASNVFEANDLKLRLDKRLDETSEFPLGRLELTIGYNSEREKLIIDVHKAENLIVCDEDNNTSDPYVRIYLLPNRKSSNRRKTRIIKNNLDPVFEERLEYGNIMKPDLMNHKLDISVKNKTGLLSSEKVLMGQVIINIAKINLSSPIRNWYELRVHADDAE